MRNISGTIKSEELGIDVTIEVKGLSVREAVEAEAEGQRLIQEQLKKKSDDPSIASYVSAYRDKYCLCQGSKVSITNNNPDLDPIPNPQSADEFMELPAVVVQKWFELAVKANPFWVTTASMVEAALQALSKNASETLTKD
jgi:hypothetical protein